MADQSFLVGIMAVFLLTGTMDFFDSFVEWNLLEIDPLIRNTVALLLFIGAAGKSAQFPFHVWLPDAMEGPTPVSALIHAATMVNAGVYFIARTTPIFATAPETMLLVAVIGTFTAVLAATIAVTQKDIKRVLAYSTLSQLGYMFMALGAGAWLAAIFHLVAHGFTKGLLFLGSGSVIHAVHGEQDMTRMGALWRKIPWTHWTFLIGALSLAGIPLFAGFFSKDAVLGEVAVLGWWPLFVIGVMVAGLTGFYMFRLMGLTFYGRSRVDPEVEPKIHESPPSMVLPLVLLAIPTVLLGLAIGLPLGDSTIKHWLEPVFHPAEVIARHQLPRVRATGHRRWLHPHLRGHGRPRHRRGHLVVRRVRREGPPPDGGRPDAAPPRDACLYSASLNKWYFDDLYHLLFYPLRRAVASGVMWFDVKVVDGIVNGVGVVTQGVGDNIRHIQTGRVQNYALDIAVGLVVIAAVFILLAR